jgi:hypothetical protein
MNGTRAYQILFVIRIDFLLFPKFPSFQLIDLPIMVESLHFLNELFRHRDYSF